ncbi:MAG: S41 family peptidase [Bacteroidaceae bacterium]|nr:S41 family peptidase [Bacteroidaceae bacterium]
MNREIKRAIACMVWLAAAFPCMVNAQSYFKMGEQVSLFNEVCRKLNTMYVDTLNPEQMVHDAIVGMTRNMDPYTVFYSMKDKSQLQQMLTGKYAGIGAVIKYCLDKKHVAIEYPFDNSPAKENGFEKGDVILAINDTSMLEKTTEYVSNHLRGEAGTTVKVKLKKRSTGKPVEVNIVRRAIQQPDVACHFIYNGPEAEGKKVGVIYLTQFDLDSYDHFKEAFLDLKRQGMEKLVIDLRGNGGGSVAEAVKIINMFIPRGELIVQTRGKSAQLNTKYMATADPMDTSIPLMVLVDEDSASASEILAGCLQDLDRAKIAGMMTYGKGIVQQTVPLQDDAELKVTVSKYYLPSGRCVQARNYNKGKEESVADSLKHTFYTKSGKEVKDGSGIIPDIELKNDTMSRIVYYLSVGDSTELVHNYVCDYLNKHKNIADAGTFSLSDADFNDFKKRVMAANFKYDPFTEKVLKNLKEVAEAEGYYEGSKAEFEALEKKLTHDISHDIDFNKTQIKSVLERDIMTGRYGYSKGMECNYKYNSVFLKALKEF